jgi:hypothetical protein
MWQIMVVAAYILYEHHAKQIPMHRGSMKRRTTNVPRNRVGGHARLYKDYFHLTGTRSTCSGAATGYETYSWSFYGASETMTP